MAKDTEHFAHQEWIGFVQPVGLVVSAPALLAAQAHVNRNIASEHARFLACLPRTADGELIAEIRDLNEFTQAVLGWDAADLSPVPDSATLPADLAGLEAILPEYHETLRPTFVVKEFAAGEAKSPWLMLVKEVPAAIGLDELHAESDRNWQASPHAKFERLLRETQVPIGLLSNGKHLRLIYAPRGETSGYVTFAVAEMAQVAGRPIFAALHMLLSAERLFSLPENQRLAAVLTESRKYQNTVSTKLAEQVLAALYELLRGFQSANDQRHGELLKKVLEEDPNHVYSGLLTVLMRLVFVLYAEDRGLMPTDSIYGNHYSVTGLFDRLRAEAGRYPDTMDHRYGAWSGLLTLFRLIFEGGSHGEMRIPRRRGYLFDADRYPFLEGRERDTRFGSGESLDIPRVSDGVVFRVLSNLLVLDGERLSYRTLDVEQIGSVYETIMGFNLEVAQGRSIAIKPAKSHGAPAALNLDLLLATPANKRDTRFKELTDRDLNGAALKAAKEANSVDDLLAALDRLIARKVTPNVVPAGAMVFQPSDERRRSGSHYTPRSLTEPIVRTTLEPILKELLEASPLRMEEESKLQERLDKLKANARSSKEERMHVAAELERAKRHSESARAAAEKQVPHPAQILDLKVCDPAMGSGAFLVEACRQLGDELVKAWRAHDMLPADIPADEDELLYARRQVAQRCLYGVDKNPMAVDLAKLSLWLATLAKDHPFTFLDHSLRHGDSLVGLTRQQIIGFHWEPKKQKSFAEELIQKRLDRATEARSEILNAREDVAYRDQEQRMALAEEALSVVRLTGDACVSAFFTGAKQKQREEQCQKLFALLSDWYTSGHDTSKRGPIATAALNLRSGAHPLSPFHWDVEFPEVFARTNGGFDGFVGNPPFAGKNTLINSNRDGYLDWLKIAHDRTHGNADLVAHFFRRGFSLLRDNGSLGLIATNTIRQGDTRNSGLLPIREDGGTIYSATRQLKWPGDAAVTVSVVTLKKGQYFGDRILDGRRVSNITAFLFHAGSDTDPVALCANKGRSFIGHFVSGPGFLFDDSDTSGLSSPVSLRDELIRANPKNAERIFPYIGGEEVLNDPQHRHRRYVINFEDMTESEARSWPDLISIIEQRVKPEREALPPKNSWNRTIAEKWWLFGAYRRELPAATDAMDRVLFHPNLSTHLAFVFLPRDVLVGAPHNVIAFESYASFSVLQSRIHESWARFFGSSLEDRLRYTPTACFETFPLPSVLDEVDGQLEAPGRNYYEHRADVLVRANEGLTKTYNRFHSPHEQSSEITHLRHLHEEMDRAVLKAYGWDDLAASTRCEFLSEYDEEKDESSNSTQKMKLWRFRWPDDFRDEVLARLLELNKQRAEKERLAGLGSAAREISKPKVTATRKKKPTNAESQESAQQEMF